MSEETTKRCPKCKEKDLTSFSSCRFCGTKYDAVIEAPKKGASFDVGEILRSWPGLIIVIAILVVCRDLITDAILIVAAKSEVAKQEKAIEGEKAGGQLSTEASTTSSTEANTATSPKANPATSSESSTESSKDWEEGETK